MFTGPEWQEPNEGNLHRRKSSNDIPRRVREVKPVVESTHENEDECMQGDHCEGFKKSHKTAALTER